MASGATVEKTADELLKELQELQRQHREVSLNLISLYVFVGVSFLFDYSRVFVFFFSHVDFGASEGPERNPTWWCCSYRWDPPDRSWTPPAWSCSITRMLITN